MTTEGAGLCFVGIGSPHGDDIAGWRVAALLRERRLAGWDVHVAASPIDLLDWVRPNRPLWVADACRGEREGQAWQVWRWPSDELRVTWGGGTHDFSLPGVLTLAHRLGYLPAEVRLWGIWGGDFMPAAAAGDQLGRVVEQVAEEIVRLWCGGVVRPTSPEADPPGAGHA
jgi:hydrogenase maturation protease